MARIPCKQGRQSLQNKDLAQTQKIKWYRVNVFVGWIMSMAEELHRKRGYKDRLGLLVESPKCYPRECVYVCSISNGVPFQLSEKGNNITWPLKLSEKTIFRANRMVIVTCIPRVGFKESWLTRMRGVAVGFATFSKICSSVGVWLVLWTFIGVRLEVGSSMPM